jgi:hypothetical protein
VLQNLQQEIFFKILSLSSTSLKGRKMNSCFFTLNNQPMSKFVIDNFKFDAFSGRGKQYINRVSQICVKEKGAIPLGSYYILDRQEGGHLGVVRDWLHNTFWNDRSKWFALYALDKRIDDYLFCNQVKRGNFRLHPKGYAGISEGCVTIEKLSDFLVIYQHIKAWPQFKIPGSELMAYGVLHVKASTPILKTK